MGKTAQKLALSSSQKETGKGKGRDKGATDSFSR
jgi:hypothetical protein